MSGQRATDHTRPGDGVSTRSRAVRAAAVIASVFALAVCGAVAQASSDSGGGTSVAAKAIDAPKAGAAPTSVPTTSDAQPPENLGDDADLDDFAQSCFDGDLVACDHLYLSRRSTRSTRPTATRAAAARTRGPVAIAG